MRRRLLFCLFAAATICCALLLAAPPGAPKDLGVRGAVWPIEEPDLLREIEARLKAMEDTGEADRMRREAVERARERVEAPPRVAGVKPARFFRIRRFDPTVTVEQDILAPDGALLAARGTRINPLERRPLTRELLFIDGTRPVEVDWALAREKPSVIVLLDGRPLDLARRPRTGVLLRPRRAARETPGRRRHAFVGRGGRSLPSHHGSAARRRNRKRGRAPMKSLKIPGLIIMFLITVLSSQGASAQSCTGRFVNPVTDVCWECLFPISIGPIRIGSATGAPDTPNPGSPICYCGSPIPRIGLSLGVWEPARLIDASRAPWCFPNLGGLTIDGGLPPDAGARGHRAGTAPRAPPGTSTTSSTRCSHGSGRCWTWAAWKAAVSTSPGYRSSIRPGATMSSRSC